jgi:hypothetical protein
MSAPGQTLQGICRQTGPEVRCGSKAALSLMPRWLMLPASVTQPRSMCGSARLLTPQSAPKVGPRLARRKFRNPLRNFLLHWGQYCGRRKGSIFGAATHSSTGTTTTTSCALHGSPRRRLLAGDADRPIISRSVAF